MPADAAQAERGRPARWIDRLVDGTAVALFLLAFLLILAQVGFRYLLDDPLVWSEEAARYLFVWVALLGWTVAARRRSHIAITTLVDRLPPRLGLASRILGRAATGLFAALLLWHGAAIAVRNQGIPTVTLPFDFWLVYAAVPVAALVLLLDAVLGIRDELAGPRP